MTKQERGLRNMAKMITIANPKVANREGRGRVTFWNPTASDQTTLTVDSNDARALTLVHDALDRENQDRFRVNLATVSGYHKMLTFSWSKVSFKVGSVGSL